jgi:hypothetical protein
MIKLSVIALNDAHWSNVQVEYLIVLVKSYAWSTIGNNSGSTIRISSSSFDLQFSPSSLEQKSFKSLFETKWQPTKLNKNRQTNKHWLVIFENNSKSSKHCKTNKKKKQKKNWKFFLTWHRSKMLCCFLSEKKKNKNLIGNFV